MPGFETLRTLRLSKVKTPIVILSDVADIEVKCRGLGPGADDWMTKPFHKDELVGCPALRCVFSMCHRYDRLNEL
jgi:two-component system cell cycle response regulator CtrA